MKIDEKTCANSLTVDKSLERLASKNSKLRLLRLRVRTGWKYLEVNERGKNRL